MTTENSTELVQSEITRETLFYAFSRPDSWIDPEFSYRQIWDTETFSPNAPKIEIEPIEMPDVATGWSMYNLTVPDSEFSRYFSDAEISEGLLDQTPDVFRLGQHMYVSERARSILTDAGEDHHNYISTKVSEAGSSRRSRDDLYIFIPKTVFYCDVEDDLLKPDIDFHPAASGAQIHEMQSNADLAHFLGRLGIWCLIPRYDKPFFSPKVFDVMQSSGLSGLEEKKSELRLVYNGEETIGHVYR